MVYLTPVRKVIEVLLALYIGGFGAYEWASLNAGADALYWTGQPREVVFGVALFALGAALIHAIGIWLNSGHRWSPLVRLVGQLGEIAFVVWLVDGLAGTDWSSANYTYGAIAVLYVIALTSTISDTILAIRGEYGPAY